MQQNWFTKKKGKYSIGAYPSSWQGWTILIIVIIAIFRIVDNFGEHPIGAVVSFLVVFFLYELVASLTLFSPETGAKEHPQSSEEVLRNWEGTKIGLRHLGIGALMVILVFAAGLVIAYLEAVLTS